MLQNLNEAVSIRGMSIPLDLGSKGTCQIGGNVSTNAGGLRALRYGMIGSSVLGLEVVLADGTVLDLLNTMRKDNSGYSLKQLFIGSEGTLGIITKVAIQLVPKPSSTNVILARVASFPQVLSVIATARQDLAELLSAFEYIDMRSIKVLQDCIPQAFNRFKGSGIFRPCIVGPESRTVKELRIDNFGLAGTAYLVIETSGFHREYDLERIQSFISKIWNNGKHTFKIIASNF